MKRREREQTHLEVVRKLVEVACAGERPDRRRGPERQCARRGLERTVRRRTVQLVSWLHDGGLTYAQAAARLGLSPATLNGWRSKRRAGALEATPRGRPAQRVDAETYDKIIAFLEAAGPHTGLMPLCILFATVARRELDYILRRFRQQRRDRFGRFVNALSWSVNGAVWAIDFVKPPSPVDGCFPAIFCVRDLASGNNLAWLPVPQKTARIVHDALLALFREHGAPLVIKGDNDVAFFRAHLVSALLDEWDVLGLPSPPYAPWYNGSCEAGQGTLKTYAHHHAARNGRPGEWTSDDIEAARLQANDLGRPRGRWGPCPKSLWHRRRPVDPNIREALRDLAQSKLNDLEVLHLQTTDEPIGYKLRATYWRQALTSALLALEFFCIRRTRFSPPIKTRRRSNIP